MQALTTVLFVLAIPTLLITSNIRFAANSMSLYEYAYTQYAGQGVTLSAPLSREEYLSVSRELVRYFNSDDELANVPIYDDRSITHLVDVKNLIKLDYRLQLTAITYILAYIATGLLLMRWAFWQSLLRRLKWGAIVTVALLVLFGVASLVGFEQVFLLFHLVSFNNSLWQLDNSSYLLQMFPERFFMMAALFVAGGAIVEAAIIGGVSRLLQGGKSKSRSSSRSDKPRRKSRLKR